MTIKYLIQSKKDNSPIYIRLILGRGKGQDLKCRTGLFIDPAQWSDKKNEPKQTSPENKNLAADLKALRVYIENSLNNAAIIGEEITAEWLSTKIDIHFKRITDTPSGQSDLILSLIDHIINTAPARRNGKGMLGLSDSRVKAYHTLKAIFREYETHTRKRYKAKDINLSFQKKFLGWLLDKRKYKDSYALKLIDNLKAVCNEAVTLGMETDPQLQRIGKESPKKETPVYLTLNDLDKIRACQLGKQYLNNARKWLLLGCLLGQRGGDLLTITESNFVKGIDGLEYIQIVQQKTGKVARLPLVGALSEVQAIRDEGLPKKISVQKLDQYIKEVCRLAGINDLVEHSKVCMIDKEGNIIEKNDKGEYPKEGVKRTIYGTFPKYELISSHTCRRTFATNLYGKLETVFIMQMTGHTKESTFLSYIGKTSNDYLTQTAARLIEISSNNMPKITPYQQQGNE